MSYTVKIWDKRPTRFHAVVCDTEAQADEVADTEMIIALIALRRGEDATKDIEILGPGGHHTWGYWFDEEQQAWLGEYGSPVFDLS